MPSGDLRLLIDTQLNTKGAEKSVENFVKKVSKTKLVKFEGLENVFQTVTTYANQAGQSFTEITHSLKELDGTLVPIESKISKVSNEFANLNTKVQTLSTSTTRVQEANGHIVTTIKSINAEGVKTKKTIEEFTSAEGYNVKVTKLLNAETGKLISVNREATKDNVALAEAQAKASKKAEQSAKAMQKDAEAKKQNANATEQSANANKRLGQSFSDVIGKVAKFYLATLPIQMFQRAITESVQTVKDFDVAITEMGKVTDYSGEKLRNYTRELGALGQEVGRTMTEMTDATTGWLKAGYGEDDAKNLAYYSALLQNTADEELSASEATSILVSQLKAYKLEANEAIRVTDVLNKVSAEEAVSSGDLAKGLTQASASMSTFGNSLEQTTALLTAGTTIFQGKSQQVK